MDARQTVQADGQSIEHVAGVVFAALFNHLAANSQQVFGVGQVFVFLLQFFQLVFTERQGFEFFDLVAQ